MPEFKRLLSSAIISLCLLGLNSNAQERLIQVSPVSFEDLGNGSSGETSSESYRLRPDDTIELTVYREDDLSTKTKLDKDGSVVLHLIGEVRLGGMTLKEARKTIGDLYRRDYLVDPQITLTYTPRDAESSGTVSVLGSVAKAGVFPLPKGKERISLREAIAMAGGLTRYGNESRIKIRRLNGNEDRVFEVNLKKMNEDASVETFYILPGDSISVPERVF